MAEPRVSPLLVKSSRVKKFNKTMYHIIQDITILNGLKYNKCSLFLVVLIDMPRGPMIYMNVQIQTASILATKPAFTQKYHLPLSKIVTTPCLDLLQNQVQK